jgi:hypothetical protein
MALLGNTGILFLFFYGKEKGRIKDFLGRTSKAPLPRLTSNFHCLHKLIET